MEVALSTENSNFLNNSGVVYVATKEDRYVEEAFLSADSIKKRCPAVPITLFTDRPHNPVCRMGCFDQIEVIESVVGLASAWSEGQLNRLRSLCRTPYKCTLHLDTDTRVVTNQLPSLFEILDTADIAMVETALDDSYSRLHYGRRMFNAGFILYRQNEKTSAWLEAWTELTEYYFRIACETSLPQIPSLDHVKDENIRRRLLCMDQISLVELLSPETNRFGLSTKTLDQSWNYRGSRLPQNVREAVKILHLPRNKVTSHGLDLRVAMERFSSTAAIPAYA